MDDQINHAEKKKNFVLRSDFTILLFLIIQGLLVFSYVLRWAIFELSKPSIYRSDYSFAELFNLFLMVFLIIIFINLIVIMLSTIVRRIWWVAIPITCLLLGLPLFSWIISLIGAQIARLLYIPTVQDLQDVRDSLKMKIRPRKKYISVYEEFKNGQAEEKPYYFSLWQSTIAALLGGFLGGGLMLSVNYIQLGDKKRFAIGLTLSIILHFILILVVYGLLVSNEQMKFVYILPFLLFIPTLANLLYNEFLLKKIKFQVSEKNLEKASWWSVVGVVLISLIFFLFCIDPAILVLREFGLPLESFLY